MDVAVNFLFLLCFVAPCLSTSRIKHSSTHHPRTNHRKTTTSPTLRLPLSTDVADYNFCGNGHWCPSGTTCCMENMFCCTYTSYTYRTYHKKHVHSNNKNNNNNSNHIAYGLSSPVLGVILGSAGVLLGLTCIIIRCCFYCKRNETYDAFQNQSDEHTDHGNSNQSLEDTLGQEPTLLPLEPPAPDLLILPTPPITKNNALNVAQFEA